MKSYVPFSRTRGYESINDASSSQSKSGLPVFADATRTDSHPVRSSRVAFGVSSADLCALNENKDKAGVKQLGGCSGIAKALHSDTVVGIGSESQASIEDRQAEFGANRFREVPPRTFWSMVFEALQDPTLLLLMAAALVSTVLGVAIKEEREQNAWSEGVAIWVAVIVVSLVEAGNGVQKDKHFRKLNARKDVKDVTVMRS